MLWAYSPLVRGGVQSENRDWWLNAPFGTLAVGAKKLETRQRVANVAHAEKLMAEPLEKELKCKKFRGSGLSKL